MIISAIVAMDRQGLIGDGDRMPWHLPSDLKRFKALTMGKPIVMGRRTFETLGRPLPGRSNIVMSRNPDFGAEGVTIARSIDEALQIAETLSRSDDGEVVIIGGGVVFGETAGIWDRLLLSVIEGQFRGDTYFPIDLIESGNWHAVEEECCAADAKNLHPHRFVRLDRLDSTTASRFDFSRWVDGEIVCAGTNQRA